MGVHVNFDLTGELGEHVAAVTDGSGWYASVEEYVRDLIRKDVEAEHVRFEAFKAELRTAFSAPEDEAVEITADEFLAQMKSKAA